MADLDWKTVLLYILAAVVLVLLVIYVFIPVFGQLFGAAGSHSITLEIRNAVSEYMAVDIDHVSHPKDLAVVFGAYIVYVKDNDSKGANYTEPEQVPEKVTFEGPCTGTYESGRYVRREEDDYFAVELSPGDSVEGLYRATEPVIPELSGYRYYGTLEKGDIYEKR